MKYLNSLFKNALIVSSILLAIFSSCDQKPSAEKQLSKNPVGDYQTFVDSLDGADVRQVSVAIARYNDLFDGLEPKVCDQGFVTFYNFYSSMEINLNDRSGENLEEFDSLTLLASPDNKPILSRRLRELQDDLSKNGFTVEVMEGYATYRQVPSFLKSFDRYLSDAMKAYRQQMAVEYDRPLTTDGTPSIEGAELAKRILWWQKFTAENPAFVFKEDSEGQRKLYINTIVRGTDNELLVDEDKISMSPFFEDAYATLLKSESDISVRLKPYFEALKTKNIAAVKSIQQSLQDDGLIY